MIRFIAYTNINVLNNLRGRKIVINVLRLNIITNITVVLICELFQMQEK